LAAAQGSRGSSSTSGSTPWDRDSSATLENHRSSFGSSACVTTSATFLPRSKRNFRHSYPVSEYAKTAIRVIFDPQLPTVDFRLPSLLWLGDRTPAGPRSAAAP